MGEFATIFGSEARAVTVYRRPAGARANGRYQAAAEASFQASMVVQPADAEDLEVLPEGSRTNAALLIHTETELRVGAAPDGAPPDQIEDAGERWEVQHVWPWNEHGGFYRALATKVGP